MCSKYLWGIMFGLVVLSCSPVGKMRKIRSGEVAMTLSVSEEEPIEEEEDNEVVIDSIRGTLSEGPIIMNAIKDTETGEMVATDIINASKVVARFRNVAERAGYVSISFDVTIPSAMSDSQWQLKIQPLMGIQNDTVPLEAIYITGERYRAEQLRGYERYRAFLASIITDSTDFIRIGQLEVFLERHYPETYAMKCDTSFVPAPQAENLFGVTQRDALMHYSKHLKWKRNERRKERKAAMFDKYVKDPIVSEGIRLDTVLVASDGDFIYRYVHTFRSRPRLKKVAVSLSGKLYEKGECIYMFPFPEELTFYISSLAGLVDDRPKYRSYVLERNVYDNTKAFIDFHQGRSDVDTTLGDNASEIKRVLRCIDDVMAREDLVLDSLVVIASCSPEGSYASNKKLSAARSEAVREYIGEYVSQEWRDSLKASQLPENWEQLKRLIVNDTVMKQTSKDKIMSIIGDLKNPDVSERKLSSLPEYRYMREKLYPKLRSVRFDFHLHRVGMLKDTVHTTELDTVYMAGVEAMKQLDYKRAVTILRPYDDYNSALAFMSADYNHSALDVLGRLSDKDPKVCYLMAMVLIRLEQFDQASKYFDLCLAYDPYMRHRANLDPEMYKLVSANSNNY